MKKYVINDKLLDEFKAGNTSKRGVQMRTKFRMSVQFAIAALDSLLVDEDAQLGRYEIKCIKKMMAQLITIQEE